MINLAELVMVQDNLWIRHYTIFDYEEKVYMEGFLPERVFLPEKLGWQT